MRRLMSSCIMRKILPMKRNKSVLALSLLLTLTGGCSAGSSEASASADALSYPLEAVELIAPSGSGSGYDLTSRAISDCLADNALVPVPVPVTNIPGEGGGIALKYLDSRQGSGNVLAVFSPPLCLIHLIGNTELNYSDNTTPIARLITDYGCFAVTNDSPYEDLNDVMDALREDPSSLRIGGTSAVGSMDHLQFLNAAKAAGITELDQIQYIGYEDGSVLAQLIGGRVDVVSGGISDVLSLAENKSIRVLAITAAERVGSGIMHDMPTCREQGIDAVFYNWRGIFGPQDMPEEALAYWEDTLQKMSETDEWKEICSRYGWEITYLNHEDFVSFLDTVNSEYEEMLQDILPVLQNEMDTASASASTP